MKKVESGSIVIVVLFIMMSTVLAIMHFARSCSYSSEIVYARQHYQQQFQAAQGLLNFCIRQCCNHYHLLTSQQQRGELLISNWPCADGKDYQGLVCINAAVDAIAMRATLERGGAPVITLSCKLTDFHEQGFIISDWTIEHV